MSDEKQEVAPVVSLIDQLKIQHAAFVFQRDQANVNLQQLVGAIYACEVMIKKHEEDLKGLSQENLGDKGNGQADEQKQEQAA